MDRAEPLDYARQAQNARLRAKLVREIQEFSHRLSEVERHEATQGQAGDAAVRKVLVNSYQEMIDARQTLLGLIPPSECKPRRSA